MGSDLYHLPGWRRVAQHPRTKSLRVDMCAAELRDPETGELIEKATEIWFSSNHFARTLGDLRCTRDNKHGVTQGSYSGKSKTDLA